MKHILFILCAKYYIITWYSILQKQSYYSMIIFNSYLLIINYYNTNIIILLRQVPLQVSNCLMGVIYSKISEKLVNGNTLIFIITILLSLRLLLLIDYLLGNWPISSIIATLLTVTSICSLGIAINNQFAILTWISLVCFSTIQGTQ